MLLLAQSMNQETTVSPDAETQNPAPDVVETPELTTPEAEGQEPQEVAKPELSDAEKEVKALKRRIDRMTQQKYQLSAENDSLRRPAEQTRPTQEQYTPDQLDAYVNNEANKRAATIAKDQVAGQKLQTVEAALRKSAGAAYNDFYEDLSSAGPAAGVFLNTVMELDDATGLLSHFVKDRDALDKVLQMTPLQQAAHMGRLSARLEAEKTTSTRSNAPAPLKPVKGGAVSSEPDIGDTSRWIKWSNEQDSLKRKR